MTSETSLNVRVARLKAIRVNTGPGVVHGGPAKLLTVARAYKWHAKESQHL